MRREIKFQYIWSLDGVRFAFGTYSLSEIENGCAIAPKTNGKSWPLIETRQYTGQKDIDKTEVFEGDLVAMAEDVGHIPIPDLFEVKFSEDGRWIIYRDDCDVYDICDYEIKVIGNSHQNKDLLS